MRIRRYGPTAILIVSLTGSLLPALGPRALNLAAWIDYIDPDIDGSLGNTYSSALWLGVAVMAAVLCRHADYRPGWSSIILLATALAIGEIHDFKDELEAAVTEKLLPVNWTVILAPVALPFLILATRALWTATRTSTLRALLIASSVLVLIALVLDSAKPHGVWKNIAEELSELMAAAILIAILASVLGWVSP